MAETAAIIGAGTTLGYSDTDGGSYTSVAELADTKMPTDTADEVEATHYLSPNLRKEFIAGWLDAGEVDLDLNYTKAQHAALMAILRAHKFWKITLPDGSTIKFPGWLKKLGGAIPNKDRVSSLGTLRVTGAPVFTPAS